MLSLGDDDSMVVVLEKNQEHKGNYRIDNRFDPDWNIQIRRNNPDSRRRSMRPLRKKRKSQRIRDKTETNKGDNKSTKKQTVSTKRKSKRRGDQKKTNKSPSKRARSTRHSERLKKGQTNRRRSSRIKKKQKKK